MQVPAGPRHWPSRQLVGRILAVAVVAAVLLVGITLLANSRLPRRAAGIYGGMFEKIRRHPQATAALCLTGVALAWVGIGLVAALEGRATRKPKRDSTTA